MKALSLKLPDKLDARLRTVLKRRGIGKSALVREALESYLAQDAKPAGGSFLELARDLEGCVMGPKDLSAGPKHLEDYGR